jgi:RND family efflux transporter MFP subunit
MRSRTICLLLLLGAACPAANTAVKSQTAVKVRQLEKGGAAQGQRYSATITAGSRVDLSFKNGGYVEKLTEVKGVDGAMRAIQEGDPVKIGQELARVRKKDFEHKAAEARAALAEASAARNESERELARATKLFGSGSISRAELDLNRSRSESARARVAGAAARVDEANTAVGDASLVSPIAGVVLKKNLEVGALITPGQPAFSVADTTKVKVLFGVPDTQLETLRVGSPQSIATEAFKGRLFNGQISRIAPAADAKSRVFEVEVTLPNPNDELKVGMTAALNLVAAPDAAPAPLVPLTAVVRSPGKPQSFAVFVVDGPAEDSTAHAREVELGTFIGDSIPVRSGLKEGEQVVVMGASFLSDGQHVRVIP